MVTSCSWTGRLASGRTNQNMLEADDVDAVVAAYRTGEDPDGEGGVEVRLVPLDEVEGNGWDLNIGRYIKGAAAEVVDVETALAELAEAQRPCVRPRNDLPSGWLRLAMPDGWERHQLGEVALGHEGSQSKHTTGTPFGCPAWRGRSKARQSRCASQTNGMRPAWCSHRASWRIYDLLFGVPAFGVALRSMKASSATRTSRSTMAMAGRPRVPEHWCLRSLRAGTELRPQSRVGTTAHASHGTR